MLKAWPGPLLHYRLQSITEPEARAAYLWVVGEYGARIQVGAGWAVEERRDLRPGDPACPSKQPACAAAVVPWRRLSEPPCALAWPPKPAQDAPYVLEGFAEGFADEDPAVKLVSEAFDVAACPH